MAQTSKKRRRKHRGTQTGADRHPRAARAPAQPRGGQGAGAHEAQARRRGGRSTAATSPRPGARAFKRGLIGAAIFFLIFWLAFGRPVGAAAVLSVVMLAMYVPMGYYIDRFMYRRRLRQLQAARGEAARQQAPALASRHGRPHAHRRPGGRELLRRPPRRRRSRADRRPRRGGRADPARGRELGIGIDAILLTHYPLRPHRRRRPGGAGDRGAGLLPRDRGAGARRHHVLRPLARLRPVRELRGRRDGRRRRARSSSPGMEIDVLFTPGHSPGHVTYAIPRRARRCSPATSCSRARSGAPTCRAATGRRCSRASAAWSRAFPRRPPSIRGTWGSPRSAPRGRPTRFSPSSPGSRSATD